KIPWLTVNPALRKCNPDLHPCSRPWERCGALPRSGLLAITGSLPASHWQICYRSGFRMSQSPFSSLLLNGPENGRVALPSFLQDGGESCVGVRRSTGIAGMLHDIAPDSASNP